MNRRTVMRIETVIDYIENHLDEKLNLNIIAEAVHYSKYHLHRMFADTTGMTIHDYVQRRQLTEAAKLLVFSGQPIIDIALLCGYESQQAFSAVFKAMYKIPPAQYRENGTFYPLQLRFALCPDAGKPGQPCHYRSRPHDGSLYPHPRGHTAGGRCHPGLQLGGQQRPVRRSGRPGAQHPVR